MIVRTVVASWEHKANPRIFQLSALTSLTHQTKANSSCPWIFYHWNPQCFGANAVFRLDVLNLRVTKQYHRAKHFSSDLKIKS